MADQKGTAHQSRTDPIALPKEVADALDAYLAILPPGTSSHEATRLILQDWLIGHGFLNHRDDPEGAN